MIATQFNQQNGDPYRVLIVDDDRELSDRYRLVLSGANMLVEVVNDPLQLFDAMARFHPEVLVLDVNMPGCSGPELAQVVRFNDDWLRVPIIYLSAETDIALQMSVLIRAGDDFVTKPISDNSLIATVFARAQRARLLSNALSRDSLTGLLKHADIKEQVTGFIEDTIRGYVGAATNEGFPEEWDLDQLWTALKATYPISFKVEDIEAEVGGRTGLDTDFLTAKVLDDIFAAYEKREQELGAEVLRELERKILLSVLDRKWREHLYEMDYLQEGIGLRAMAQRDPLVEYQKEGYELFSAMMDAIKEELVGFLFNVEVKVENEHVEAKGVTPAAPKQELRYSSPSESGQASSSSPAVNGGVSRNSPCPCGSGKKYKRCHGAA